MKKFKFDLTVTEVYSKIVFAETLGEAKEQAKKIYDTTNTAPLTSLEYVDENPSFDFIKETMDMSTPVYISDKSDFTISKMAFIKWYFSGSDSEETINGVGHRIMMMLSGTNKAEVTTESLFGEVELSTIPISITNQAKDYPNSGDKEIGEIKNYTINLV